MARNDSILKMRELLVKRRDALRRSGKLADPDSASH